MEASVKRDSSIGAFLGALEYGIRMGRFQTEEQHFHILPSYWLANQTQSTPMDPPPHTGNWLVETEALEHAAFQSVVV
jgi:hypothetical protein